MEKEKQIEFIRNSVLEERQKRNIKATPGLKPEGSCFATPGGEMGNLFWSQLVPTSEGTGEWSALKNDTIREALFEYIKR